jgi:molybdopterin-containing oxidoreductase family membrane subunit
VDYSILIGSFGWFFMWFLLFVRQLPVIAISETKEIVPPRVRHAHAHTPEDAEDFEPQTGRAH